MTPDPVLEPRPDPALLSLVIPLHDEAAMLPLLREALEAFAPTLPCEVEFVLVNDGSHDATLVGLLAWAAGDRRVNPRWPNVAWLEVAGVPTSRPCCSCGRWQLARHPIVESPHSR
jgi:hypothetical protein